VNLRALTAACALAGAAAWAGCGRRGPEPPPREPPRVYEQGECGAVMTLAGMTGDEVAEGVASAGITALQSRMRVKAEWNQAHLGHWVRWSVDVGPRDADMRERGLVLARCLDGRGSLMLVGLNATSGATLNGLQGGERLRVVGWLDEMGLVVATSLHVESVEVTRPLRSPPSGT